MAGPSDPRGLEDRGVSDATRSTGAPSAAPAMVSKLPSRAECLEMCRRELSRRVTECERQPDPESRLLCMAAALGDYARCERDCSPTR